MARILIGWELGANRGHIERITRIAEALAATGHEVALALQRLDAPAGTLHPRIALWQAPVWPRLLVNAARPNGRPVATMGDILARVGLDRSETSAGMVAGWQAILGAVAPAVVIADYAPMLLTAARGRVPTIGVGTGFERVPAGMDHFPSLNGREPAHDEAALLDGVNRALARLGVAPLPGLPELFHADVSLSGCFAELDPYAAWRREPVVSPTIARGLPEEPGGRGDELFVYGFEIAMAESPLWDGIARTGLPVRVHVPNATVELQARFAEAGFAYEPRPLGFDRIAERSRILLSHGGNGFVSSALVSGIPQAVTHYDLEKRIAGHGVMRLGVGGQVALQTIKPDIFAASLRALYDDETIRQRCLTLAPSFRTRAARPLEVEAVAATIRLAA